MPNIPQNRWNMSHNKEWLKQRGLSTKGTAGILKKMVADEMKKNNPALPRKFSMFTIDDIAHMMILWHTVLTNLMVPETNTEACERAHMSIIMFLNQFAFIDSGLKNDSEKPQWLSTFNLLSLLNCRQDLERFGPNRSRWEGQQEKFIQLMKREFIGFVPNWQQIIMKRYYVTKSMSSINENIQCHSNKQQKINDKHHIYSSSLVFHTKFESGKPIYMIQLKNKLLIVGILHNNGYFWNAEVTYHREYCGGSWFGISFDASDITEAKIKSVDVERGLMAFPQHLLTKNNEGGETVNIVYHIIGEDWTELNEDLVFVRGKVAKY